MNTMKTMKKISIAVLLSSTVAALTSVSHAAAVYKGGCLTSDFTVSTDCIGLFDPGNDNGVNNIFASAEFQSKYGTDWTEFSSSGFTYTGLNGTSGTWALNSGLSWEGYDVLGILKAGNFASAYEMDTSVLSGKWDISGTNWLDTKGDKKPQNDTNPGLSHLDFYVKSKPVTAPEPSMLGLLAGAFLSFGFIRRKIKKS